MLQMYREALLDATLQTSEQHSKNQELSMWRKGHQKNILAIHLFFHRLCTHRNSVILRKT